MERKLIDIFLEKHKKLFPTVPISLKKLPPRKAPAQKDIPRGIWQLDTSNSLLATIAASLDIRSPHKDTDLLPILYLEKDNLAAFLKGYFDGDGGTSFKKKANMTGHYTDIRLYTISKINAKRLHQMLLKLNISNKIFRKDQYNIISVESLAAKTRFIEEIGTNHPRKKEVFEKILELRSDDWDSHYPIGFHFKNSISHNKKALKSMGGNLSRALNGNMPITRGFYRKASALVKLPPLDDCIIEKITKVEKIESAGFVYDMTVPDAHNFLIETGFISSNCHDIGIALGCGAHMAELRRTKAAAFNESHLATLQDLADAHYYYKEGNEEPLRKILLPIEAGVQHLHKVWIHDSAVDALCHGMQLKTPGISKLDNDIQKDDLVAVMTLKEELVLVGLALMPSKEMMGEKGIAVKTQQVFMKPGTYQKQNNI